MKRDFMILEGDQMSADDWTDEINSTLMPEYWWIADWKTATVMVHHQRIARQDILVLERFIVGLGVGCAIERHHAVRFRDCRKRSPQMKAIFEWFCGHYSDVTQPQLAGDRTELADKAKQLGKKKKGAKA